MHQPYSEIFNHKPDFRVKYKFYQNKSRLRETPPFQGIRSDFQYADDENKTTYMIWPEFEDTNEKVITYNDNPVPITGTARMWIINPERRPIHIDKIKIGTKCHFIEGGITADCEVIEIVGLPSNPTK